jgi:hypothetical protein
MYYVHKKHRLATEKQGGREAPHSQRLNVVHPNHRGLSGALQGAPHSPEPDSPLTCNGNLKTRRTQFNSFLIFTCSFVQLLAEGFAPEPDSPRACLKKFTELYAGSAAAHYEYAKCLEAHGVLGEALEQYERVRKCLRVHRMRA